MPAIRAIWQEEVRVLGNKWKDEVKILSCQQGELSLEGKQWGGGRGLFSYELINGMAGMADKNKDGKVSLRELSLYLMEKVPEAADPMPQNPVLNGNMNATVAIKKVKNTENSASSSDLTALAELSSKGLDESLLKGVNNNVRSHYLAFNAYFAQTDTGGDNLWKKAYDEYLSIPYSDSTKVLLGIMKSKMAIDIINEIEKLIERRIHNRGAILGNIYLFSTIDTFYLNVLTDLMGENKLIKTGIQPKILYIKALNEGLPFKKTDIGLKYIDQALTYDSSSYLFELKGKTLFNSSDYKNALANARQATFISPDFTYPYETMGDCYMKLSPPDFSNAALSYKRIFKEKDASTKYLAQKTAIAYFLNNQIDSSDLYFSKFYKMDVLAASNAWDSLVYNVLSTELTGLLKAKDSCESGMKNAAIADAYVDQKKYTKALEYFQKAIATAKGTVLQLYYLKVSNCCALSGNMKQANEYLEKVLQIGSISFDFIADNESFDPLRKTSEFKALMKKYFPNQYKE